MENERNWPGRITNLAAQAGFTQLTDAEHRFLQAVRTLKYAVCGPNFNPDDKANDPRSDEQWPQERSIRADLIRWVCVNPTARGQVDPQGIQLFGAAIAGELDLSYVTVPFPITLNYCRMPDTLNLFDAHIRELDLSHSCISNLYAYRVRIEGSLFLRYGFRASGEVRINGAEIGNNLECDDGDFDNSIRADDLKVSGSVFLRGSRARGQLRLVNAVIGSNLELDGGEFVSTKGAGGSGAGADSFNTALNMQGVTVRGDLFLRKESSPTKKPFISHGDIELVGAQIGGDLDCTGADIDGVLDARRVLVKGALIWMKLAKPTALNLRDASAYALRDDPNSWPPKGSFWPEGFVYVSQVEDTAKARSRLEWLDRMVPFSPRPYRQLAKVLKEAGDLNGATEVLMEMERLQQSQTILGRPVSAVLRTTVGYGYHPLWAFWELLGLAGLGWVAYRRGYRCGAMTPTEKEAYEHFKEKDSPPLYYQRFSPLVYSIENSLPLIKLGQADCWAPDPNAESTPGLGPWKDAVGFTQIAGQCWRLLRSYTASPSFLRGFLWVQIILGWILATLFAAGVTGIIHAD